MARRSQLTPDARAEGEGVAAVYLPLGALRPNPRNPRAHGSEVERLARTILRTTWGAPIIAQASTRRIIGGHGRLEAARLIAAGMVVDGIERGGPTHRFDRDAPAPLLLPVRLVDVSDAEAEAMTLADNAKALQGVDDAAAVVAMATASFDRDADVMREMGYGAAELDALVKSAGDAVLRGAGDITNAGSLGDAPRERVEVEEDEAPVDRAEELRAKWKTAQGQLWEVGPHRILCGDCRKPEDVARLIGDRKVNVAFTSPPYASQREYDPSSGFRPIPPDEFVDWFDAVQANVRARLADDGSWFVNIKEHAADGQRVLYVKDLTIAHVRRWGWRFVDEFVWKHNGLPGSWDNRFKNAWEPVFHFSLSRSIRFEPSRVGHASEDAFNYAGKLAPASTGNPISWSGSDVDRKVGLALPGNVIEVAKSREAVRHEAVFPVGLPAFFIQAFSDEEGLIFDPFLGSASTIVAAHKVGRIGCGAELSPKYVAVALERLAALGLEPRLVP